MNQLKARKSKTKAFTLLELMLISAIIGLLAAIALPKFADSVVKSKEAVTKGKLGSYRSALSIYYSDNEGTWPNTVWDQFMQLPLKGKYIDEIPRVSIPTVSDPSHQDQACTGVRSNWDFGLSASCVHQAYTYDERNGRLAIDCTHPDTSGRIWSSY